MDTADPPSPPPIPPLAYAPPLPGRPGLLTTVGVLSVIVGALSLLACVSEIGSGVGMLFMSNMTLPALMSMTKATAPPSPGVAILGSSISMSVTAARPSTSPTTMPASAATPTPAMPMPIPPPRFHVDRAASILTIIEAVLSAPVALLVLIGGILIFRNSPAARPLHRWYVILKLPLIALFAIATWWTYSDLISSFIGLSTGPAPSIRIVNIMAGLQVGIRSVLSLAYPVFLMVVFLTRTWRNYFNSFSQYGSPA